MTFDLTGKRIVVSGGGGRLGSRLVAQLNVWGADVVALVTSAEEARRVPAVETGSVDIREVDIVSERSVVDCFSGIGHELGQIDAFVHTVGMWSASPLTATSHDDWRLMIDVNLTSAFLCFRESVRLMLPAGGSIIGIASRQGVDGGVSEQAAYSAAKAGVARLVESVAAEYQDANIACHAIAPSTILFDEDGEGVQANEIVNLVAFLVGGGRSTTGTVIRMYGG